MSDIVTVSAVLNNLNDESNMFARHFHDMFNFVSLRTWNVFGKKKINKLLTLFSYSLCRLVLLGLLMV